MGMLRRVAVGVALACIMGGTAYAVDEDVDNECTEQLSAAEEAVQNKIDANALNDADAEKVNDALGVLGQIDTPRGTWTFNTARSPQQTWYLRELRLDGAVAANLLDSDLVVLS